ncbi:helix-turn-helix domain-containing protein [Butyrivibrio sp.]|uniref:helix-turn-helix domain-containing protein n=1 Tax=Butyrivibrio sp. TaxID=28121 RepID=UPI0025C3C05B|nr:helix-turn-helix transcriptional regulator [Butyrivibrio sp.]MBQ9301526.1 helix-turn-helix transcriptional regulator [Butyrivibrio sp.]
MNNSKLIPERLINARESLNISKAEASRKIGLSKIGYNRYESGERTPSPQMMQVIANTLNTSVDYLVGITDNPGVDTVQLNRQQDAELFDLVLEYKNADSSMKKRILAYAKAFQK